MEPWTLLLISTLCCLCVGLVAQYGMSMSLGGVSIQKSINRTGDHANSYEVTLPVAWAVSSWDYLTDTTANGNLTAGHGQTTGTYDVYWTGGSKKGVTVTVTVNSLALAGGTGTAYPADGNTTVVICKQVSVNAAIDGDAIAIMAVSLEYVDPAATAVGRIDLLDGGSASIEDVTLVANTPQVWDITGGATNVFTGNPITSAKASHNHTSLAGTLKLLSLEDSTP